MTQHHHYYIEVTDWWCPDEQRWVWCPGPCPDGREHGETRTRDVPVMLGPVMRPRHKESA